MFRPRNTPIKSRNIRANLPLKTTVVCKPNLAMTTQTKISVTLILITPTCDRACLRLEISRMAFSKLVRDSIILSINFRMIILTFKVPELMSSSSRTLTMLHQ